MKSILLTHAFRLLIFGLFIIVCSQTSIRAEHQPRHPIADTKTYFEPPEFRWDDQTSRIRSLIYQNQSDSNGQTEVFAFYATPGSIANDPELDKNLPAVVLIHGGGGTAFAEWVWLWAKRGYAAIAMDLSGRRPSAPKFDPETGEYIPRKHHGLIERTRLENGGPEADHLHKFTTAGNDLTDDWQYHAVPAVIRAHSLIRSFSEVDERRTAVTGISWGGYLTCLVASIDHRFKAAVPVYGCGFLYDGQSVQRPAIDRLPETTKDYWIKHYDPSVWLEQCRVPIFFVNGTHDKHYPLGSYRKSFDVVPGEKHIRIEVKMPHSHRAGWQPREIGDFIDNKLLGTPAPPLINGIPIFYPEERRVRISFHSDLSISKAELHYTTDDGPLVNRTWKSIPAEIKENHVIADWRTDATIWLISLTDERGAMVSTAPVFTDH